MANQVKIGDEKNHDYRVKSMEFEGVTMVNTHPLSPVNEPENTNTQATLSNVESTVPPSRTMAADASARGDGVTSGVTAVDGNGTALLVTTTMSLNEER